jgi:hypothetical protein
MFKGKAWKRNTTLTAFAFPGAMFTLALILNFFFVYKRYALVLVTGLSGLTMNNMFVGRRWQFRSSLS